MDSGKSHLRITMEVYKRVREIHHTYAGVGRRKKIIQCLEYLAGFYPKQSSSAGITVNRSGCLNLKHDPDLKYLLKKGKIVRRRTNNSFHPTSTRNTYITLP
jgi:hypothetical protein